MVWVRQQHHSIPIHVAAMSPGKGTEILLKVSIDPITPASVKVRAAEAIFNHAAKAIEIEDIEARVELLERAAEASKGAGR